MVILSTLESTNLDESIKCPSRWFILAQRKPNLEFVNLKCVTHNQVESPYIKGGGKKGVQLLNTFVLRGEKSYYSSKTVQVNHAYKYKYVLKLSF